MINIKIQKKDLWLLAAIMVFLVGVAYVIAYNSGASPSVMGHSAEEIEGVCLSDGTNCPNLGGGFGVWNDRNKDGVADTVAVDVTYTAETDGFVIASIAGDPGERAICAWTPVGGTLRAKDGGWSTNSASITIPVKKGNTWRVEIRGGECVEVLPDSYNSYVVVNWLPIGN